MNLKKGVTKMAQIDRVNFELAGGLDIYHVNISDIVGIGGTNEKNDVMLVQALFILLGYTDNFARRYFGMCKNDLPKPTGNRDDKTFRAIWRFQVTNAARLLNTDGKIHPARYKNRVIKDATRPLMAITF